MEKYSPKACQDYALNNKHGEGSRTSFTSACKTFQTSVVIVVDEVVAVEGCWYRQ